VSLDALLARVAAADLSDLSVLAGAAEQAARYDWPSHARPEQLPPPGDWRWWVLKCGRGWGKSRTAAEHVRAALKVPGTQVAVIARSFGDVAESCFEHRRSGLLTVIPPGEVDRYLKPGGKPRLYLRNGSVAKAYSADALEALRGPDFDLLWADEFAFWPGPAGTDFLRTAKYTLRESRTAQIVITSTPLRTPHYVTLLKECATKPGRVLTGGPTSDNRANLAEDIYADLEADSATRIGRQEFGGELDEDAEGASWSRELIAACRVPPEKVPGINLNHVVIAVDPSGSEDGDECGVIVLGTDVSGVVYVIADHTLTAKASNRWDTILLAAQRYHAGEIVYESNGVGADLGATLVLAWNALRLRGLVTGEPPRTFPLPSTKNRVWRHGLIASLFEQTASGVIRILLTGKLTELVDQCCTWDGADPRGVSPGRIDAMCTGVARLTRNLRWNDRPRYVPREADEDDQPGIWTPDG
jgi:phage terminase large subunit-like protein